LQINDFLNKTSVILNFIFQFKKENEKYTNTGSKDTRSGFGGE
jgi:hypothetical protein